VIIPVGTLMLFYCYNECFLSASKEDSQMMLVLPIDDVDLYKKRDRLIVKVYFIVNFI
jgi:hypothetical protein